MHIYVATGTDRMNLTLTLTELRRLVQNYMEMSLKNVVNDKIKKQI